MPKVGGIVSHRRALSQFCFELCPCYVNKLLLVYFVKNNVMKFSVKQWIGFAFPLWDSSVLLKCVDNTKHFMNGNVCNLSSILNVSILFKCFASRLPVHFRRSLQFSGGPLSRFEVAILLFLSCYFSSSCPSKLLWLRWSHFVKTIVCHANFNGFSFSSTRLVWLFVKLFELTWTLLSNFSLNFAFCHWGSPAKFANSINTRSLHLNTFSAVL